MIKHLTYAAAYVYCNIPIPWYLSINAYYAPMRSFNPISYDDA